MLFPLSSYWFALQSDSKGQHRDLAPRMDCTRWPWHRFMFGYVFLCASWITWRHKPPESFRKRSRGPSSLLLSSEERRHWGLPTLHVKSEPDSMWFFCLKSGFPVKSRRYNRGERNWKRCLPLSRAIPARPRGGPRPKSCLLLSTWRRLPFLFLPLPPLCGSVLRAPPFWFRGSGPFLRAGRRRLGPARRGAARLRSAVPGPPQHVSPPGRGCSGCSAAPPAPWRPRRWWSASRSLTAGPSTGQCIRRLSCSSGTCWWVPARAREERGLRLRERWAGAGGESGDKLPAWGAEGDGGGLFRDGVFAVSCLRLKVGMGKWLQETRGLGMLGVRHLGVLAWLGGQKQRFTVI